MSVKGENKNKETVLPWNLRNNSIQDRTQSSSMADVAPKLIE